MLFLVYCPVSEAALPNRLGTAEYSYRFVLEGFRPVLEKVGTVLEIRAPETEADRLFAEAEASDEECRLICFCPPNLAPVGLRCPTTVVLAWEFDTIPSEPWNGDVRNDWRTVLTAHGQAITLSEHSRQAIFRAVGDACHVTAIPVPVIGGFSERGADRTRGAEISFRGHVIDSRSLACSADGRPWPTDTLAMRTRDWNGERLTMSFGQGDEGEACLLGCYDSEGWGTWSRLPQAAILLPFALSGRVHMRLTASAYGRNVGRKVTLSIGGQQLPLVLSPKVETHRFTATLNDPANLITLGTFDIQPVPDAADTRSMGIGLVSLEIRHARFSLPGFWQRQQADLPESYGKAHLSGIVYASVLNPKDGRKNWADILSAFCYALGDREDATLVFKMTHFSAAAYLEELFGLLAAIGPVRARILVLHGFLNEAEYRRLIGATAWYVNASHGEGLCLPLMEFMAGGVPAIAPDHTAMADYVNTSSTLVVKSSRTPTRWPNDPFARTRTLRYRIDWQSLVDQFRESYRIVTAEPRRYAVMSTAARATLTKHASAERVSELFVRHLREAA
jgi:glycosyltransferase involved in cell wall biosynthesis